MGPANFLSCGSARHVDRGGAAGSKAEREGIGKLGVHRSHARLGGGVRRAVHEAPQTTRLIRAHQLVREHRGQALRRLRGAVAQRLGERIRRLEHIRLTGGVAA